MRIFVIGICGTFMAGVATLAARMGHSVQGCDEAVYPPMSDLLEHHHIAISSGYDPSALDSEPDHYVIGNALSRGNPMIEHVMAGQTPYCSGPQWLAEYVLSQHRVMAVAGTHGKTTTSSMLAWILTSQRKNPGYLIGGVPNNLGRSAWVQPQGARDWFVIEADEYDTAFFDKRPKFIHYKPQVLVLNNLEFDHADIYTDVAQIELQFHYLLRTLSPTATVIVNGTDRHLKRVLQRGIWSKQRFFFDRAPENGIGWWFEREPSGTTAVMQDGKVVGTLGSKLKGDHMRSNAIAAIAAAAEAGIAPPQAIAALHGFGSVARRLQYLARWEHKGALIDDFAHHPTAIKATLAALKEDLEPGQRTFCICELGSFTMRSGAHGSRLPDALKLADRAWLFDPYHSIDKETAADNQAHHGVGVIRQAQQAQRALVAAVKPGDQVLVLSNTSGKGLKQAVWTVLKQRWGEPLAR